MTRRFRLGPWEVDRTANRLRRDGKRVHLEPKVMDLLVALAERPGEVLSRDLLLDSVWPGTFVSDEVLTTAVYQLRRALGDHAREPWLVETVPKRGYRLLAAVEPVREAPGVGAAPASEEGLSPASRHPLPRTGSRAGAWRWSAAVAVALGLAALGLGRLGPHATPGPDPGPHSRPDPELGPEHPAAAAALRRGWEALDRIGPEAASEALALLERAVVLAPEDPRGLAGLAEALVRALALEPGAEDPARGLAKLRAGATAGPAASPPPDARELLSRLASKADGGRLAPSHVASLYAELGDEEEALEWLDRAWRSRDTGVFFLRYDSRWEPYLDHPRVRGLLSRLSTS